MSETYKKFGQTHPYM